MNEYILKNDALYSEKSSQFIAKPISNIEDMLLPYLPYLENLDPSNFQNVILGILAIYLPFAIVFLTDLLEKKQTIAENAKADFEKAVLKDEVFKIGQFFWLSTISVAFFAFLGEQSHVFWKIIAIIVMIVITIFLWRAFKRLLDYSKGENEKQEFELRYLDALIKKNNRLFFYHRLTFIFKWLDQKFQRGIFKRIYENIEKKLKISSSKIVQSWENVWLINYSYNQEDEFLKKFINHIEYFLDKKFHDNYSQNRFIAQILHSYSRVIGIRKLTQAFSDDFFHKIIFWSTKVNCLELFYMIRYYIEHFTKYKHIYPSSKIFKAFKMHLTQQIDELDKKEISNEEKNNKRTSINQLCDAFYQPLFDYMATRNQSHTIFPDDWHICSDHYNNPFSRIMLDEFLKWAKKIKNENQNGINEGLHKNINLLFTNVDGDIFSAFLKLYFTFNEYANGYLHIHNPFKDILEKSSQIKNFSVYSDYPTFIYQEGDFATEVEKERAFNQQESIAVSSYKQNTLKIIFKYPWPSCGLRWLEFTKIEYDVYKNACLDAQKNSVKTMLKDKWQNYLAEIEKLASEIQNDDEQKKRDYRSVQKLLEAMIQELENDLPYGIKPYIIN